MTKLPPLYLERIRKILPPEEIDAFIENVTRPLDRTIRVKKGSKIPSAWTIQTIPEIPEAGFLTRPDQKELPLGRTLEHFCGDIYAASLTSLLAVKVLDPQSDEKILDLCAAPGSKTSFIADLIDNTGCIVANEPDGKRLQKLTHNLHRMGCVNTTVLQYDGTKLPEIFTQEFDRILLDAPCSGDATARRQSDFFVKHWSPKSVQSCAKLQRKLITAAWQMLAPGGTMVYSTCTTAPEENELAVQYLCTEFGNSVEILPIDLGSIPCKTGLTHWDKTDIKPEISTNVRRLFPHLKNGRWEGETFFIAKIRKASPLRRPAPTWTAKTECTRLGKNEIASLAAQLQKQYGMPRDVLKPYSILLRQGTLMLTTVQNAALAAHKPFRSAGLPLQTEHGDWTTEFWITFGDFVNKNHVQLSPELTARWIAGYDIPLSELEITNHDSEQSTIVVKSDHHTLGYGRIIGSRLKNKLPRNLIP